MKVNFLLTGDCDPLLPNVMHQETAMDIQVSPFEMTDLYFFDESELPDELSDFILKNEQCNIKASDEQNEHFSMDITETDMSDIPVIIVEDDDCSTTEFLESHSDSESGYGSPAPSSHAHSPASSHTPTSPFSDHHSSAWEEEEEEEDTPVDEILDPDDPDWSEPVVMTKQRKQRIDRRRSLKPVMRRTTSAPRVPKNKISRWLAAVLHSKEHNPSVLKWIDKKQGVFKVANQEELARLWGIVKKNPEMDYEKLSRAMRYYYKTGELVINSKKLHYQFGKNYDFWKSPSKNLVL